MRKTSSEAHEVQGQATLAGVNQVQLRCSACRRRLADFVNEVRAGQVLLEVKCPRCGQPHLAVIRPSPPSESVEGNPEDQMDA